MSALSCQLSTKMFRSPQVFTLRVKLLQYVSKKFGIDYFPRGADFETAIVAAGFGRFHYCLIALCGLIYCNTAIGVTIMSFVLPAATCDFKMTSEDKGWLIAAPMLGMVLGSYFWGCLADTKGRKTVLIATLFMDGICGTISSIVQKLAIFMVCRFFCGFAVAGAMGLCFPYLGEFQPTKYRETILCWMEVFWTLGVILLPLLAWAIIPIKGMRIVSGGFTFDSWNLFVAACALPSLLLGVWLVYFPESPKFLMEVGDGDDALACFQTIYKLNTGDNPENYPIKNLSRRPTTGPPPDKSIRNISMANSKDLARLFRQIWSQTKKLCKPPNLFYTVLTSVIQFGLMTSYFTLMIWFPELFNRYTEYEKKNPGAKASVCEVASAVSQDKSNTTTKCDSTLANDVYFHTLIIGVVCIPVSLWLPLCINRIGAKIFLILSLVVAGCATFGLYFVKSSFHNLVLSCIFEAFTSVAVSLMFCVLVELYPTNLRVMAAAVSLTVGRVGGLVGNLLFGFMIDLHCIVPILVFTLFLFGSAILCLFLPTTGQTTLA